MAMIEIGESSAETPVADDLARVQARLEDAIAECRKYKEEREVFGREVVSLRGLLQAMIDRQSLVAVNNDEVVDEKALSSPTPLHSMLDDCSNYLLHLKSTLDEQLNSEGTVRELYAVLYTKDQEIEDLSAKVSESSVSRDVIVSYMGSLWETCAESLKNSSNVTKRLLASLAPVVGPEHASLGEFPVDVISLVETNILSFMEKQRQILSEIQQLGECLSEVRPDFSTPKDNEFGDLFKLIHAELLESKRREALLKDKIDRLEEDNKKLALEHEQSENKLAATREKLSMAVTKGKSLVQTRDSLKQSLAEKASGLERCMLELQQKSDALLTTEANAEDLKRLLAGKTSELESCMQELQEKAAIVQSAEASAEELKQMLAEKSGELDRCMVELQQKCETLQTIEASAEELKQSFAENTSELERCMLELQQKSEKLQTAETKVERCMLDLQEKSDALQASEASTEELKHLLAKKTSELESCMLELQKKSDASQAAETSNEELKQVLDERTSELEKCLVELQQKCDAVEIAKASAKEMNDTNNMVASLQDLVSQRDNVLREIEEVMSQSDCPRELLSMEAIDRIRWFVDQKNIANVIFQENRKVKDALSSIDLPESISTGEMESQISWLVSSFTQAKDDVVKLQHEVASAQLAVASHESELSEAHKEIDRLAASLMEEKQEKDSFQNLHDELRSKYEKSAGELLLVSSEKNELLKVLLEVSGITVDDLPSLDTDMVIKKCSGEISERKKTSVIEIEWFERMQSLLYVRDQELILHEKIIEEEEINNRSATMSLSEELGRVSEEIITLRNEKYSLQKELSRAEEKNSLLREKLSMAVKKGKGLMQEREGFKLSLDGKNSEIEKFKHELQLKDSAINEYQEQIKSMSAYAVHIQKLESDIVSLQNQKDQSEQLLLKNSSGLQRLADSIDTIVLPTDNIFEGPVDKLNWIAEHVRESELVKAHKEQEIEKIKKEATLQASQLVDALATIKSLEDALSHAEKNISLFSEEKKDMQLGKASMEEQLYKLKEESSTQARMLADANATIKLLEDTLSQAEGKISLMEAEKNEAEFKSQQEIMALNTKLAERMEELAGARGNMENHSAEMNNLLKYLQKFIKDDEALLSLMNEEFRKKIDSLRNMGLLMQNLHDQFAVKGLHIHPGLELDPAFAKLLSLLSFDDFIENKAKSENSAAILDDFPSLTRITEGLHAQAKLLQETFENLSKYMDEHIAVTLQALHVTSAEVIHLLEFTESLKLDVDKLNNAQKAKLVSLQKEMMELLSAFTEATQELRIDINDVWNLNSTSGQGMTIPSQDSRSKEAVSSGTVEGDESEFIKIAEHVLHVARGVNSQSEQLMDVKRVWLSSIDDLKHKLKQAELTAETAIQDQHLSQERVFALERDLEALGEVCNEMKIKIEDFQAKEDVLKRKEQELLSLEHALTATGRGTNNQLFSEGQVKNLIDKVNKIKIHFNEPETPSDGVHFSNPVDKLFYVIENFSELQHTMETLTTENEDMQLLLETHVRETEHLKKAADTVDTNNQELESMKDEFVELTVGMERVIQRLGGNESFEDHKATAKTLFPVLERLIVASTIEFEDSKSKLQDLGVKLQIKEKVVEELSAKLKTLEDSTHPRLAQPDTAKERTVFEASSTSLGSEISEIEDVGPLGKNSIPPVSTAAHARTMRKGSNDHLVLNIDSESDRLISGSETDDKGHVFKSLNTSGLIPKQGKLVADKMDSIWVSGGRILMSRPRARLGLIAYWIFLHLWLLGTIL